MIQYQMRPALILIDIQKGFLDPVWGSRNNPTFEENVSRLLSRWREKGGAVYHVQHLSMEEKSPLRPDRPGAAFMDFAMPRASEPVIQKKVNSAFIRTGLESMLRGAGHTSLLFAGLTTDHCVSTSVRMAANLGFKTMIAADATATFNRVGHDGQKYEADWVHSVSLASLQGEFAEIHSTVSLLTRLEP
ncbi:MAG: cysteine hydrolase family protein [Bdellovibrionia bacterium]